MNILKSQLEYFKNDVPFIDASDAGIKVCEPWPEYIEVIDGDYVVDRYENLVRHHDEITGDLLSAHYSSATGKKLIVIND